MRLLIGFLLFGSLFFSCNNGEKIPDVSGIKINISTKRFEQDLFAIDSSKIQNQLMPILAKYPSFGQNFLGTILSADPRWSIDSTASYVGSFVHSYKSVFDTSQIVFKNFEPYQNEIKNGLQFVKYYFPAYKIPTQIITYIGPADGYGDILSEDALLIGLQNHLGKDYSLYKTRFVQETYAPYLTNRFEPDYIAINCLKNIVTDLYPEQENDKPLAQQMVEKGKRLYVLHKLLPYENENKLIGYTKEQLDDCYKHEAVIWDLFVKNNYLQLTDKEITKNYIDEGPKTPELGEKAPGNIGSFCGWQIIKKYMLQNENITLTQLMNTDAEAIFESAKYKP